MASSFVSPNHSSISKSVLVLVVFVVLASNFGSSDIAQDRAECADKLVGLATCLAYVSGEAKAPTQDCCIGIKQVLDKSKKCLCVLIKDRDDPSLQLNINATLAVHLPTACHAPGANISECVDLLHLAPNSAEAKMFEGLAKAEYNNSARVSKGNNNNATASTASSDSDAKNDGGWGNKRRNMLAQVVCDILPLIFIFQFLFLV